MANYRDLLIPHYCKYFPSVAPFVTDVFIKMEMLVCLSPEVTADPYHNMPGSWFLTGQSLKCTEQKTFISDLLVKQQDCACTRAKLFCKKSFSKLCQGDLGKGAHLIPRDFLEDKCPWLLVQKSAMICQALRCWSSPKGFTKFL